MTTPTPTAVPAVKPGVRTTEFWLTFLAPAGALLTLVDHQDFSGVVQSIAIAAAGVSTAVYAIARTLHKIKATVPALPVQVLAEPIRIQGGTPPFTPTST